MPTAGTTKNQVRRKRPISHFSATIMKRTYTTNTITFVTGPLSQRMIPLLIVIAVHVTSGFVPFSSSKNIPLRNRWSPSFATTTVVNNSTATFTEDVGRRKKTIITKPTKPQNRPATASRHKPKERSSSTIRTLKTSSMQSPKKRKNNLDQSNNTQNINGNKSKKRKTKNDKYDQFQWLHWVYKQWIDTSPGDLTDENVIRQMMAAIPRWSRRRSLENARRAEDILDRLIQESLAGNPHMRTTSSTAAAAPLLLSVSDFNAAMDGYGKIGNPHGVQRILRKMESLRTHHSRNTTDFALLQPDEFSMSTLATAWAKSHSDEAAQKAEAILQYMDLKGLVPNTITYNAVLHAIAVGNESDKAVKAEDIVQTMKHRYETTGEDCQPDVYTYQSLIQAWSRTSLNGAPQKAERILRFLDNEASSGKKGSERLAPNVYCFTTVIHCWARSSEKNRARQAYQLLNVMTRRYQDAKSHFERIKTKKSKSLYKALQPNVKTYTSVLNACARPVDDSEKEDAFAIAQLTMAELSVGTYGLPNFLSYAAYLSVCATTLESGTERDAEVKRIFEECVLAGEVGQIVLEKLYTAASPELWKELIGEHLDEVGHVTIPPSWSKSLKGERPGGNSFVKIDLSEEFPSKIPKSSLERLENVQKYRGQSSIYSEAHSSSSTIVGKGEETISWSNDDFSWGASK